MLAKAKTHVLIGIAVWAALVAVLMPLLGPWGGVLAGALTAVIVYFTARATGADAVGLCVTGMVFTAIGAVRVSLHDGHRYGTGVTIVETVVLATVIATVAVMLARRSGTVDNFKAAWKTSTAEAAAITERAEAERARQNSGRPDGYSELGLRRSARLGGLTSTVLDHAGQVAAATHPAADVTGRIRKTLAKDPGLLPHLHHNIGNADVDENVRRIAARLIAEATR